MEDLFLLLLWVMFIGTALSLLGAIADFIERHLP